MFLQSFLYVVFADKANKLSTVAGDAGNHLSQNQRMPGSEQSPAPTTDDLIAEATEATDSIVDSIKVTGQDAVNILKDKLSGDEKESLLFRLKAAMAKLKLIKRHAKVYSRAADKTISIVQDDFETIVQLDRVMRNGWSLPSSFGNRTTWAELEEWFNKVMEYSEGPGV